MRLNVVHKGGALAAVILIAAFWMSTVLVEWLGSADAVATVKHVILLTIPLLIVALAATNISGFRLHAKDGADVGPKRVRAVTAAVNGLVVLVPAAILLDNLAAARDFSSLFVIVQAVELAAGALNFALLLLNVRDGLRLKAAAGSA